jgi:hypothetical protein
MVYIKKMALTWSSICIRIPGLRAHGRNDGSLGTKEARGGCGTALSWSFARVVQLICFVFPFTPEVFDQDAPSIVGS